MANEKPECPDLPDVPDEESSGAFRKWKPKLVAQLHHKQTKVRIVDYSGTLSRVLWWLFFLSGVGWIALEFAK